MGANRDLALVLNALRGTHAASAAIAQAIATLSAALQSTV
jgi:hypothetical protein